MGKAFISYQEKQKDGSIKIIEGIFDLIERTSGSVTFSSEKNEITIFSPNINKVKKLKEETERRY